MCRYLETGEAKVIGKRREVVGQTKDGKLLIIELLLNRTVDPSGQTIFVAVLNDITGIYCHNPCLLLLPLLLLLLFFFFFFTSPPPPPPPHPPSPSFTTSTDHPLFHLFSACLAVHPFIVSCPPFPTQMQNSSSYHR